MNIGSLNVNYNLKLPVKFYKMVETAPTKLHYIRYFLKVINWKTLFFSVFFVLFIYACKNDKPEKIEAITNRAKMAKLHATEISTVISDSGITRYRISAPIWNVYDKATQPYWEFPKGIHFERFDQNLKVDANIHSKYAKFNINNQMWELRGKVKAINLQGELFETEQLFWNQRAEMIYSDTLVKITQATRVITGIGFQSNQSLTDYTIRRPQGIFPIDDKTSAATPTTQTITKTQTTTQTTTQKTVSSNPTGK